MSITQSNTYEGGSKQKLVNATIALLASKGYESTGIAEILEAAHVSKSNFYYHFKSKEALCLAALDKITHIFFTTVVNQTLGNAKLSPQKRLERYFDYMIEVMETQSCAGGDIFTNLEAETSDFHPPFREKLDEVNNRMLDYIRHTYQEGIDKGQFRSDLSPAMAGNLILSLLKGTMILSKAKKTSQVIHQNKAAFFTLISNPGEG